MKIFGNIRSGIRLVWSVLKYYKDLPRVDRLRASGDLEAERAEIASLTGQWVNYIIASYDQHYQVEGRENIPEGPCVFIANHQAYCDVMAIFKATEGKQVGFIAKEEFSKVPFLSRWILAIRGLFIRRGDSRESLKTIQEGADLLNNGFSLVIFPEGKRSCGPGLDEFKPGSFKLATKAKVPVVPVTINGTYTMFEERDIIERGKSATVIIHPAIETRDMDRSQLKDLPDQVREIIKNALPEKGEGYIKDWSKK